VELVPHHFYPLLGIHGQKGALDPWHIPLVHLGKGGGVCPGMCRGEGEDLIPAHTLPAGPGVRRRPEPALWESWGPGPQEQRGGILGLAKVSGFEVIPKGLAADLREMRRWSQEQTGP
jgi:hypothetical protein